MAHFILTNSTDNEQHTVETNSRAELRQWMIKELDLSKNWTESQLGECPCCKEKPDPERMMIEYKGNKICKRCAETTDKLADMLADPGKTILK